VQPSRARMPLSSRLWLPRIERRIGFVGSSSVIPLLDGSNCWL
jgi:hypothetical protein